MIAMAHYGLRPSDITAELARRAGTSGIEEKALRKALAREGMAATGLVATPLSDVG